MRKEILTGALRARTEAEVEGDGTETKTLTLREYALNLAEDVAEDFVDRHCPAAKDPSEWDLDALDKICEETFGLRPTALGLGKDDANAEMKEKLKGLLHEAYKAKESELGSDVLGEYEKFFMLQTVDTLWKDHLLALDHLKEGIGLRGYGQRDPLVEYKKESFQLFEAMKEAIEEQILQYLFRFQVRPAEETATPPERFLRQTPTEAEQEPVTAPVASSAASRQAAAELAKKQAQRQKGLQYQGSHDPTSGGDFSVETVKSSGPKVCRNDPCPCGSGKKYKKCHGAAGAGAAAG